jgi:hypothetical protein
MRSLARKPNHPRDDRPRLRYWNRRHRQAHRTWVTRRIRNRTDVLETCRRVECAYGVTRRMDAEAERQSIVGLKFGRHLADSRTPNREAARTEKS